MFILEDTCVNIIRIYNLDLSSSDRLIVIIDPVFILQQNLVIKARCQEKTAYTATGDWRPILSLAIGCLICGFFWKMWNFYAYPKWIYHVPFVDFLHIFEMPIIGYIPFAFELFALYHLITGLFKQKERLVFIQISFDKISPQNLNPGE